MPVEEPSGPNKAALQEDARTAERVQRFGSGLYARHAGFPPNVPVVARMAQRYAAFGSVLPLAESLLHRWSVSGRRTNGLPVLEWRRRFAGFRPAMPALSPAPLKVNAQAVRHETAGARTFLSTMGADAAIAPDATPGGTAVDRAIETTPGVRPGLSAGETRVRAATETMSLHAGETGTIAATETMSLHAGETGTIAATETMSLHAGETGTIAATETMSLHTGEASGKSAPSISREIASAPDRTGSDTPESGPTHQRPNVGNAEINAGRPRHHMPAPVSHELPAQRQKALFAGPSMPPQMGPPIFRRVSLREPSAAVGRETTPPIPGGAPLSRQKAPAQDSAAQNSAASAAGDASPIRIASHAAAHEEVRTLRHAGSSNSEAALASMPSLSVRHPSRRAVAVSRSREAVAETPAATGAMLHSLGREQMAKDDGRTLRSPEQSIAIGETRGAQPSAALLASATHSEAAGVLPETARVLRVEGEAGAVSPEGSGGAAYRQPESFAARSVPETPDFRPGQQLMSPLVLRRQEPAGPGSVEIHRQISRVEEENEIAGNVTSNAHRMVSPAVSEKSFSPRAGDTASAIAPQTHVHQADRSREVAAPSAGIRSASTNAIVYTAKETGQTAFESHSSPGGTPVHAALISSDSQASPVSRRGAETELRSASAAPQVVLLASQGEIARSVVVPESVLAPAQIEPVVPPVHALANAGTRTGYKDAPGPYVRIDSPVRESARQPAFSAFEAAPRINRSNLTHRFFEAAGSASLPSSPVLSVARSVVERQAAIDNTRAGSGNPLPAPATSRTEVHGVAAGPAGLDLSRLANRVYELLVRRLASERQRRGH